MRLEQHMRWLTAAQVRSVSTVVKFTPQWQRSHFTWRHGPLTLHALGTDLSVCVQKRSHPG